MPHPLHFMARTRKVLHYAISRGGEYLCEFSSLVLMMSLGRISESGRWRVSWRFRIWKWKGKEAESPEGKKQKEVPHPLHGSTWQGQGKYFTMLFLRRRVPRWTFLTSFDDESREDFWVWTVGGKIVRRNKWNPRNEARSGAWKPLLQWKRGVPWRFSSLFFDVKFWTKRGKRLTRVPQENRENFLKEMEIGRMLSKFVWINNMLKENPQI